MKYILRSSTLFKVLILFFILTIPFYVMSLIVYYRSSAVISENILSYNQAQLSGNISILEKDIENIQNLQTSLVNNADLHALAFSPEDLDLFETVLSKRDLRTSLEQIRLSSRYIRDVRAYLFADGSVVSCEEGVTDITERDYSVINACLQNPLSKIFVWQERLFIGFFFPYPVEAGLLRSRPKVYLILAELDGRLILNYINPPGASRAAETVLYFSSGESAVSTGGEEAARYLAAQTNALREDRAAGSVNITYGESRYIVAYQYSPVLNTLMLNYMPEESAFLPLTFYRYWLTAFMLLSLAVILTFSYIIYVTVHKPMLRQKILLQQAELRQLQSKINPHFLYNAFLSISTIAYAEGGEMSSVLAQKLGRYFRYVTRESSERVSFSNELEYARLYAEIQEMRFSNRLRIIFDELPDERLGNVSLPPFILQPLIENALEHGLANKTSGGTVRIGLEERDGRLIISVEDNGNELSDEKIAEISRVLSGPPEDMKPNALCNINLRLKICFGNTGKMTVGRSVMGGLRAEIAITL